MTKIENNLKELLGTENEWIPQYNNLILPAFIMGKAKHNNRTGINKFGSGITKFISYGRRNRRPIAYSCDFKNDNDGYMVLFKLRDFGIYVPLQTNPSTKITLSFGEANKLITLNKTN